MFVGSDVAKGQRDVAVHLPGALWSVPHDAAGIATLGAQRQAICPTAIVLEAADGSQRAVVAAFAAAGLPVVVVHPRQTRNFAQATGQLAKLAALGRVPRHDG
jgi:transposase